jgi:response regulator RpfG family c-di-GMP phosphodiesterase
MHSETEPDIAAEGSVRALIEVLALASPESYARSVRLGRLAGELLLAAGTHRRWHIETAALVCQIGGVAAPRALRTADGAEYVAERMRELTSRLPELADAILAPIQNLDDVRSAVLAQRARFDGCSPVDPRRGTEIPLGGRVLRVVIDYDDLTSTGTEPARAITVMRARPGSYDPSLLDALDRLASVTREVHSVIDRDPLT